MKIETTWKSRNLKQRCCW